jgi:hypothetical protein
MANKSRTVDENRTGSMLRVSLSSEEKFTFVWGKLSQRVTGLSDFKGGLKVYESGLEFAYDPIDGNISTTKGTVDLLYDLCTLAPNQSRGVGIILKHEVGHSIMHGAAQNYSESYSEAAAELFAIKERGFSDLIDGIAVLMICSKKSSQDGHNPCDTMSHYAVNMWNNKDFMQLVGRIYPEAPEIAKCLPFTGPGKDGNAILVNLAELVEIRVKEIEHDLAEAYKRIPKQLSIDFKGAESPVGNLIKPRNE